MGGPWIVGSARASLQPLPVVLARTEVRRVAWDGTSSWSRTRYSVPAAYAGEPLLVWELDSGELGWKAPGRSSSAIRSAGRALWDAHRPRSLGTLTTT